MPIPGLIAALAVAQTDVKDLSLDELLDQPVAVTTKKARTVRQAPGVVRVITREEILASGARDLLEVLQLVPGFSFHADVEGVVGVGFRGLWGHEGKVLLLIDGVEQNELLYSTTQFGHHVLVHGIERIEVIRGPGSAIYGGTAELAVINVLTRSGADLMGGEVAARYAQTAGGYADYSGGLSAGWYDAEKKLDFALNVAGGQGRRTTRTYTDFAGASADLRSGARLDPFSVAVGVKWQGLTVRFLADEYAVGARVGYGALTPDPDERIAFKTVGAELSYELPLGEHVVLRPRLSWRSSTPWQSQNETSPLFYSKAATRTLAGLGLQYDPRPDVSLLFGVETFADQAWLISDVVNGSQTAFAGKPAVGYSNTSAYAELLWDTEWVNVAVGGRFEQHSQAGPNFAPRIALTRALDRFHFKLLYSGAFRSPSIENLNLNPALKPEQVQVAEGEVGVSLFDLVYASVNGFHTNVDRPIAYLYDDALMAEQYQNASAVTTAGVEAQLVLRGRHGFANLSYAFAQPLQTSVYAVPGVPGRTLGFALHTFAASGKGRIWRGLTAGGSLVVASDRYGFTGPGTVGPLGPSALLGLWVGWEDLGLKGLGVQLGGGNLLDQNVPFVQPYDSGAAPIPGRGREIFLRVSYALASR